MIQRKKFHKRSNRPCPECGSLLVEVSHIVDNGGVEYSERFIECDECGYSQKIKNNKHQRDKIIEDYLLE